MRFACHGDLYVISLQEGASEKRNQSILFVFVCSRAHSTSVYGENLIISPHHVLTVSYGRILSSYPAGVVSAVATLSIACLIVVFTLHSVPDFSDPQLVSDDNHCNNVSDSNEIFVFFSPFAVFNRVGISGTFTDLQFLSKRNRNSLVMAHARAQGRNTLCVDFLLGILQTSETNEDAMIAISASCIRI